MLSKNWFRRAPYTKYSALLYNFLSDNSLYVVNFSQKQKIDCTYHKDNHTSYLDHVTASKALRTSVLNCEIRAEDSLNVSDHIAISLEIKMSIHVAEHTDSPALRAKNTEISKSNVEL
jgi:exonuclease III